MDRRPRVPSGIIPIILAASLAANLALGMALLRVRGNGAAEQEVTATRVEEESHFAGREGEVLVGIVRDGTLHEVFTWRQMTPAPPAQPFQVRKLGRDAIELQLELLLQGDVVPLPELPVLECLNHYRLSIARVRGQRGVWRLSATIVGGPVTEDRQCVDAEPSDHPA